MTDQCSACGKDRFTHSFEEADECKKKERNKITTLRVKKITRDLLAKICTKEMSFDDVIMRLLNHYSEKDHVK